MRGFLRRKETCRMRRHIVSLSSTLVALGLFSYAGVASAQAAPAAPPPADTGNDHDSVVGHFGVGYFGIQDLPIGTAATKGEGNIIAPVIGARYWIMPKLGIDAGVGFSDSSNGWGVALHGGVPLALATSHHFTFEVTPEATLAFTGNSNMGSYSGFLLDLGARAGAEIQFGFIGIPQLALQASVGLYLQHQAYGYPGNTPSVANTTLATSFNGDPWGIFTDNISALYYF
jgi:hypothetical protein